MSTAIPAMFRHLNNQKIFTVIYIRRILWRSRSLYRSISATVEVCIFFFLCFPRDRIMCIRITRTGDHASILRSGDLKIQSVSRGGYVAIGLNSDLLILRCVLSLSSALARFHSSSSSSIPTSIVSVAAPRRRSIYGIMRPLPNFAMCELGIVSRTVFSGTGAITARALNGPGPSRSVHPQGTRDTREDVFPSAKYGAARRVVSNVITLDSCLLCSSTTKSYSALTSKAKLPSDLPPVPPFPRTSSSCLFRGRPSGGSYLFPLFYVVTTFGQRTLTKVDEKGGDRMVDGSGKKKGPRQR